jgi:hypothetical protein
MDKHDRNTDQTRKANFIPSEKKDEKAKFPLGSGAKPDQAKAPPVPSSEEQAEKLKSQW